MNKYKFIGVNKGFTRDDKGFPVLNIGMPDYIAGELEERFKEGSELSIDISEKRQEKTTNQNNYLWALIGEICQIENGNKRHDERINLYRNILVGAGIHVTAIMVEKPYFEEAISRMDHLRGYIITGGYIIDGKVHIAADLYFGITQYDKDEMKDLIDATLAYAEEVGLDRNYWRDKLYVS
jgi:hypothetical protein